MIRLTPGERGLLLLCSDLGEPDAHPLSAGQYRRVCEYMLRAGRPAIYPEMELTARMLVTRGCDLMLAERVSQLMSREEPLAAWLHILEQHNIVPLTRLSTGYPARLRKRLGAAAPLVLYGMGNLSLSQSPAVSVVGSRVLTDCGRRTAERVGRQLATRGEVLCSGGASGADDAATCACLNRGGAAVLYLPSGLLRESARWQRWLSGGKLLLLSESALNTTFHAHWALGRNHYIHAHGRATVVCQCAYGRGGTWNGTVENLKNGWSPVYVADDGSEAAKALLAHGARVFKG